MTPQASDAREDSSERLDSAALYLDSKSSPEHTLAIEWPSSPVGQQIELPPPSHAQRGQVEQAAVMEDLPSSLPFSSSMVPETIYLSPTRDTWRPVDRKVPRPQQMLVGHDDFGPVHVLVPNSDTSGTASQPSTQSQRPSEGLTSQVLNLTAEEGWSDTDVDQHDSLFSASSSDSDTGPAAASQIPAAPDRSQERGRGGRRRAGLSQGDPTGGRPTRDLQVGRSLDEDDAQVDQLLSRDAGHRPGIAEPVVLTDMRSTHDAKAWGKPSFMVQKDCTELRNGVRSAGGILTSGNDRVEEKSENTDTRASSLAEPKGDEESSVKAVDGAVKRGQPRRNEEVKVRQAGEIGHAGTVRKRRKVSIETDGRVEKGRGKVKLGGFVFDLDQLPLQLVDGQAAGCVSWMGVREMLDRVGGMAGDSETCGDR